MSNRIFQTIGALLLSTTAAFSETPAPFIGPFTGACDGSAAVALDGAHFVVADDDSNVLRVYDLQTREGKEYPFETFLATSLDKNTGKPKESDIEGAALNGDRIYWIASHGRKSKGKADDNRKRLFAARLTSGAQPGVEHVGAPYRDLRKYLLADQRYVELGLDTAYGVESAEDGPKPEGDNGFNIEGLAATADGQLLIGFRNPQPQHKALIAPLRNPAALVDGKDAKPDFGDPILLDLGGKGIRSIERVGARYLIVAGPYGDAGKDDDAFQLREWSGDPKDGATKWLQNIARPDENASPEALFALPGGKEIVVLFDEGDRESGAKSKKSDGDKKKKKEEVCKDLEPNEKSFRGVRIALP